MSLRNSTGMTLLELMISIAILAVLSTYTAIAIQEGTRRRGKVDKEIAAGAVIRDALRVVEADINRAFNYQDFHTELFNQAQIARRQAAEKKLNKNRNATNPTQSANQQEDASADDPANPDDPATATQTTSTAPGTQIDPNDERFKTRPLRKDTAFFIGEANEIHFTSLNNIQINPEEPASSLAEISYTIETCKGRLNKKESSKCLLRRVSNYVDDKPEEGGQKTVLLENIETFEMRFYDSERDEWRANWNSRESQDEKIKNHFPGAVEAKLIVLNPKEKDQKGNPKEYGFNLVAAIRFQNNPQDKKVDTSAQTQQQGQSTSGSDDDEEGSGDEN